MEKKKLEIKLDESVRLRLLKDRAYEGKNNYGAWYLYSVSNGNGEELSFFAPVEIHEQIVKHGLKTGSEFILRAVPGENGKRGKVQLSFEPVQVEQPVVPLNGTTDNFKAIMQQSLKDAIEIMQAVNTIPFQNDDIRALSSCLFIARTRSI